MGLFDWLRDRRRKRSPAVVISSVPAAGATAMPVARDQTSGPVGGFAVIDVETTGLDSGRDRVVEIAVVRTDAWG